MKKNAYKRIAISALVGLGTYCSSSYFGNVLTRTSSLAPTDVVETQIDTPTDGNESLDYFSVTSTWNQPSEPGAVRPEILFVVDTSGSMGDEKNALINALGGWLENLQSQKIENFCVDVMESTPSASNAGRLRAASGNDKCLCTDKYSVSEIVSKFKENINSITFTGGAGEAGLYSIDQALNNPDKLAANQADGCFRYDHALTVIAMTDENDMGATVKNNCTSQNGKTSDGTTVAMNTVVFDNSDFPTLDAGFVETPRTASNYVNNSCDEAQVRLQYYSEASPQMDGKYHLKITPKTVADSIVAYNDSLPTFGTGIVYNTTTFPSSSSVESKGWGVLEFADELGQETANLATTSNATSFNGQMNKIADAMVKTISFFYTFTLPNPVCEGEEDSVEVKVNGDLISSANWSLNTARTKVVFKSSFDWTDHGGAETPVEISFVRCE